MPVPDPVPGPLEITIATNGGRVDGTMGGNNPVPKGIEAVLVPADRGREDLYRVALSDASGHFALQGIAPGDYKLFAWQDTEPNAYRNADFLKTYEAQGQSVHITDSATATARVNVIP
jgi:hypothetical protein